MPSQRFAFDGGAPRSLGAGVIYGTAVDVAAAGAWRITSDQDEHYEQVDFDSSEVDWRTVYITIDVTQAWGDFPSRVKTELSISGDQDYRSVMSGLASIGNVVVALDKLGTYELTPEAYPIEMDGQALGQVEEDHISFPAMGSASSRFTRDTRSLPALAERSKLRPATISVTRGERAG